MYIEAPACPAGMYIEAPGVAYMEVIVGAPTTVDMAVMMG